MKTSFYFVIWIVIYPLLGLLHNPFIDSNSFLVALLAVFGLSWWLNRSMPKTLAYERLLQAVPVMEDIYTGNVRAFVRRLAGDTRAEIFTSLYFIVASAAIAYIVLKCGSGDWLAMIVFGLFTFGAIYRSLQLNKALEAVKDNPTPEQCAQTAADVYRLNYAAYELRRSQATAGQMLPPRPPRFRAFQVFSAVIACVCVLCGLVYVILAVAGLTFGEGMASNAVSVMYLLYGSLAAYFGVKDLIAVLRAIRRPVAG